MWVTSLGSIFCQIFLKVTIRMNEWLENSWKALHVWKGKRTSFKNILCAIKLLMQKMTTKPSLSFRGVFVWVAYQHHHGMHGQSHLSHPSTTWHLLFTPQMEMLSVEPSAKLLLIESIANQNCCSFIASEKEIWTNPTHHSMESMCRR